MKFDQIKNLIVILVILGIVGFVAYQHLNGDIVSPIKSSDNSSVSCPAGYHIQINYKSPPECYRNK